MQDVFSLSYFGPISYYAALSKQEVWNFDLSENFQKQSYRNRCEVLGANGRLNLIVPVQHDGNRGMNQIKVSYAENWTKVHLKSLQSAYMSSPYFEYYEDYFSDFYDKKVECLKDLLLESTTLVKTVLDWDKPINLIHNNFDITEFNDRRNAFHPKVNTPCTEVSYPQVFEDKFKFEKDLSILDLIFNLGPQSKIYIDTNYK